MSPKLWSAPPQIRVWTFRTTKPMDPVANLVTFGFISSSVPREAKEEDLFLILKIDQITYVSLQFLFLNFRFIPP